MTVMKYLQVLILLSVLLQISHNYINEVKDKPLFFKLLEPIFHETLEQSTMDNMTDARNVIIQSGWVLDRIELTRKERRIFWDTLKGKKKTEELKGPDLELATKYITAASDLDWRSINFSDWGVVKTLGKMTQWSRQLVSLFVKRLIELYGTKKLLSNAKYINRMGGLFCGFSGTDLKSISRDTIMDVKANVLNNLFACTKNQLKILRVKLVDSTAFGHPQAWSAAEVKKLGHIIWTLDEDEINLIRPTAWAGINESTLKYIRSEVLEEITPIQFQHMNTQAKIQYHQMVGVLGGNVREYQGGSIVIHKFNCLLMFLLMFTHLLQVF